MPQEEIASAIQAVSASRPFLANWKETTKQQWAEYHKQQEVFDHACEKLCKQICQADENNIFAVLFSLSCSRFESAPDTSSLAGHMLFYLKPICPISCKDALRIVSKSDWDISLEEVPWYLADFFGNDTMRQSLSELEAEDYIKEGIDKREAWFTAHSHLSHDIERGMPPGDAWVRLDTVRYWLDIFVDNRKDILGTWEPFWRWHRKSAKQPMV
jgi:hypothetical protein